MTLAQSLSPLNNQKEVLRTVLRGSVSNWAGGGVWQEYWIGGGKGTWEGSKGCGKGTWEGSKGCGKGTWEVRGVARALGK